MADIMKCSNSDCEMKESCKRFTAQSSDVQAVMKFSPTDSGCNFYLQDKSKKPEKSELLKRI
jgi:hypothetical protein